MGPGISYPGSNAVAPVRIPNNMKNSSQYSHNGIISETTKFAHRYEILPPPGKTIETLMEISLCHSGEDFLKTILHSLDIKLMK